MRCPASSPPVAPEQCTVAASVASELRTSKRPSRTAHDEQQPGCLDGERLQEEDAAQSRPRRGTCHLEVARAGEDDATLHHMVFHDWMQRAQDGRAEDHRVARCWQASLRKGVGQTATRKGASTEPERWL